MIKCPSCGELIRHDSKKCFVCEYVFTEFDMKDIERQQKEHAKKLELHKRLSVTADIMERLATLLLIVAMCLILPTIGDFITYNSQKDSYTIMQEIRDDKKHELLMLDKNDSKYEESKATISKDLDRINKQVESDESISNKLLFKAIASTVVTVGSVILSIVLFVVRKIVLKKRNKLL